MVRTRWPAASAPVVARLRISTGGACRVSTVTCSDTTDGQNRLAENFGTVRASAPVSSAVMTP